VVIVATNHSDFEQPEVLHTILAGASTDCLLVDPWDALGTGQVFGQPRTAAATLELAAASRDGDQR
jgi:UDP-N-acetyl-D-mannosaminuronic acid dehydrogenase